MWYILNFHDHTFRSANDDEEAERIITELAGHVGANNLEIVNGFLDESRYDANSWMQEYKGHSVELPKVLPPAEQKRMFYIDTPVGRLKVWAKNDFGQYAEHDDPENFPGMYVDLVREGHPDTMMACIEWESCNQELQACLYANFNDDDPTHIVKYDISKLEEIEAND